MSIASKLSTNNPHCFTVYYYTGPLATGHSAHQQLHANMILFKLKQHGFPAHKWMDLATGLMMGGSAGKYYELKNDLARLTELVTDWTASADEAGRWETL